MPKLRLLTVVDQAEQALLDGIVQGRWKERLPSFATLAAYIGVSIPSVGAAVARLARTGAVVSRGPRRSYLIGKVDPARRGRPQVSSPMPSAAKSLLMVGPVELRQLDSWRQSYVLEVMREGQLAGWRCDYARLPSSVAPKVRASWQKVLDRHPASHLLVMDGSSVVAKWALSKGLTVGLLGGPNLPDVASLAVSLEQILEHVVGRLARLGHRRVLFPLWGAPAMMPRAIARTIAPLVARGEAELIDRGWVSAFALSAARRHREQLRERVRRLDPTAIVNLNWRDYLVTQSVLAELGLGMPRDLSVVVLDADEDMRWSTPVPAHFQVGQELFLRRLFAWLRGRPISDAQVTKAMFKGWVDGETLGRARD